MDNIPFDKANPGVLKLAEHLVLKSKSKICKIEIANLDDDHHLSGDIQVAGYADPHFYQD